MRGLRLDDWELDLKLAKNTKRLVELGINMWHVRPQRVLLSATVVALQFRWASLSAGEVFREKRRTGGITHLDVIESFLERALNCTTIAQVLCEFFLLWEIVG